MNTVHAILLFFIYACLGWCCEVAFAALQLGEFVNRGFLNGPVCPIYGFGVIGVALALSPFEDNLPVLYLGSTLLATAIEYLTGWTLEKLFHARWWDYTEFPLNLRGYVCLPFSMLWGAACVVIVKWVHPMFAAAVGRMPAALCIALDGVFCLIFTVDLCASVAAVQRLSDRLTRLTEAAGELHAISDELGQNIFAGTQAAREHVQGSVEAMQTRGSQARELLETRLRRIEAWFQQHKAQAGAAQESIRARYESARQRIARALEEKGFGHRRLLKAFPGLRSYRNQEALEALRRFYQRHRERDD